MPAPPKPATFGGTQPEWAIYWAHGKLGLVEGVDFTYQDPFSGGRLFTGGAIVDFLENDINVAIRIQGLYFHGQFEAKGFDDIQRVQLEGSGLTVVDIDDDDANENPIYFLKEARRGISHSKLGRN